MSTHNIWYIHFEKAIKKIIRRINTIKRNHRLWRRNAIVSAVTVIFGIATVMSMTGVLFFTNDVIVTSDGVTKKYFTMNQDAQEILKEFNYSVGEYDRVVYGENRGSEDSIEIIRGFPVEVTIDGDTVEVGAIPGETYTDILAENGFQTDEYDVVITGKNKINVVRGFGVDVTADGKTVTVGAVDTTPATVEEILQRAEVSVGVGDIINMNPDAGISEGDEVIVGRVTYREKTHVEEIPFETVEEYSNLVEIGDTQVTEGANGEITFVFREKLVDGKVVTSEVMSRDESKKAQPKVISHGMALKTPYSKKDFPEIRLENGLPVDYIKVISGKSTAYTAPSTAGTASGRKLEIGTVAVNPNIIPYGSLLYIVSSCGNYVYGAAIAADTGGFINYEDRFVVADLFMGWTSENYPDALRWGVKNVDVYVINSGIY